MLKMQAVLSRQCYRNSLPRPNRMPSLGVKNVVLKSYYFRLFEMYRIRKMGILLSEKEATLNMKSGDENSDFAIPIDSPLTF